MIFSIVSMKIFVKYTHSIEIDAEPTDTIEKVVFMYLDNSGFTADDIERQRPYAILYRKEILDDGKFGVRKFDRKLTLSQCNVREGDELMCALKLRFPEK